MSLAGVERQFNQESGSKKAVNRRWNYGNLVCFLMASIILGSSSFVILSYVLSSVRSIISSSTTNPTSIPWITNKSDCQYSSRTWRDDKCWDYEHSSMF